MINVLLRVIFASVLYSPLCYSLDLQNTALTENLQASITFGGLSRGLKTKLIANHLIFMRNDTKQLKISLKRLPLCPKRAAWLLHCIAKTTRELTYALIIAIPIIIIIACRSSNIYIVESQWALFTEYFWNLLKYRKETFVNGEVWHDELKKLQKQTPLTEDFHIKVVCGEQLTRHLNFNILKLYKTGNLCGKMDD